MQAAQEIAPVVGVSPACSALGISPATFYRNQRAKTACAESTRPRSPPPRALDKAERRIVLDKLDSPRFADRSPTEVYATLLDEGEYYCSVRTMYRILNDNKQVRERRNQLTHPDYAKPELLATAPNQVWSWDITKLKGAMKWSYYYLYVIIDIFSRYVVGWMLAERETAFFSSQLIAETVSRQGVEADQLIIHSDRGGPMRALTTAQLLASLGITRSFSRPHVSDDNPFSETQFKTLKYSPLFPERFGCYEDALSFCRTFFGWYNNEHRHSGIGLMTPASVHYGTAGEIWEKRKMVLEMAFEKHPERFVKGTPLPPKLPSEVWINKPVKTLENIHHQKAEVVTTSNNTEILAKSKEQKRKENPKTKQ